jgi:hypothetical protein
MSSVPPCRFWDRLRFLRCQLLRHSTIARSVLPRRVECLICPKILDHGKPENSSFGRPGRRRIFLEEVTVQRAANCVCFFDRRRKGQLSGGLSEDGDRRGTLLRLEQEVWRVGAVGDEAAEALKQLEEENVEADCLASTRSCFKTRSHVWSAPSVQAPHAQVGVKWIVSG